VYERLSPLMENGIHTLWDNWHRIKYPSDIEAFARSHSRTLLENPKPLNWRRRLASIFIICGICISIAMICIIFETCHSLLRSDGRYKELWLQRYYRTCYILSQTKKIILLLGISLYKTGVFKVGNHIKKFKLKRRAKSSWIQVFNSSKKINNVDVDC